MEQKAVKLAIGLPTRVFGSLDSFLGRNPWLVGLLGGSPREIQVEVLVAEKCAVSRARNKIVAEFLGLSSKADWLGLVEEYRDEGKLCWAFFEEGVVKQGNGNRWLSEDYWLDAICRRAGIPIYADTRVVLKHHDVDGSVYPKEGQVPPWPGEEGVVEMGEVAVKAKEL